MPQVILAQTARVEMIYQEGTELRENVFHCFVSGPSDPDLELIADTFDAHDDVFGQPLRGPDTALRTIIVTNISTGLQAQFTKPIIPPRAGTGSASTTPGNVTSTVSWRSAFVGRQFRGRSYMVGTPYDQITAGETITGGRAAALSAWAVNLIAALAGIDHILGVASFTHDAFHGILTSVVETVLDSQRRRLPGRGR